MSERLLHERIIEMRGYKYIKLKSGRLITFWDSLQAAERAESDLVRSISRAFKLVDDDYNLERLEWFVERLETYVHHLAKEIEKRRGIKTKEERIALLRNASGRTPEEADLYRRKADELEARL